MPLQDPEVLMVENRRRMARIAARASLGATLGPLSQIWLVRPFARRVIELEEPVMIFHGKERRVAHKEAA
jgi:hypothetical protein